MKELAGKYSAKIKTADELLKIVGKRPRKKTVIMCHGTFDVVHPGHIRHLLYAKGKGDILVASLTCDRHVMKGAAGDHRPFVPEDLRAVNLAAFEMVDYVIVDREEAPLKNIAYLEPDYFAKGFEYVQDGVSPKTQEEMKVVESYGGEMIFTPGDIVYSSSQLIEMAPPNLAVEKLTTLMEAEGISFAALRQTLAKLKGIRLHVVGDTIVDSYSYCSMIGGLTKTPTFSLRFENRTDFTGGAGVVSKHLKAAGGEVVFSTVLGDDALKDRVIDDLRAAGVVCKPIIDNTRPTTNKNVFIASGYRLLKLDTLDNQPISDRIVSTLAKEIADTPADAVVFSDFRHGIFNKVTIPRLTRAIPKNAYRVADSQVASRWGNILEFHDFDLITPNEREARFALGDQDLGVRPLAQDLYHKSKCKTLILKLADRGLITYRAHQELGDYRAFFTIDSFADQVVDAVGAGDALLAYATLTMVATGDEVAASILGSFAAAIECEHEGNVPVTLEALAKKIDAVESRTNFG